jgi:GNAT superfamily N-acetyltransferase
VSLGQTGPRRGAFPRLARALLDRIRAKPIDLKRRLVYRFELREPIPSVASPLPLRFEIEPDPAEAAREAASDGAGELLFRALAGDEVVYRMRIARRREELLRLLRGCDVSPRPIFFYDCLTEPQARGKSVYPAALAHALGYARAQGHLDAFIRVARDNAPSIRGIERAGFRPAAVIVHAALFGIPIGPFGRPARWPAAAVPSGKPERS